MIITRQLTLHKMWLDREPGGVRLVAHGDLSRDVDLAGVDLRRADLRGADMRGACLQGACLRASDLRGVDLEGADLRESDLRGADLRSANLGWADFRECRMGDAEVCDRMGVAMRGASVRWSGLLIATLDGWDVIATPDSGVIGCQQRPHEFWRGVTQCQIEEMGGDLAWIEWKLYGGVFLAMLSAAEHAGWPHEGDGM